VSFFLPEAQKEGPVIPVECFVGFAAQIQGQRGAVDSLIMVCLERKSSSAS
jgi:hypothetical protein